MTAAITDLFKACYNSANPNVARVNGTRVPSGASLSCDNLAGWPTTTAVSFSTYKIDTNNAVIAGSQTDWLGIVSGSTIGTLTRITGAADTGSAIGDVVEMNPTANWADDLVKGLLVSHDQDGTLKAGACDNSAVYGAGTVPNTALQTQPSDFIFDHIASGCVWSGDAYASTKAASCTSGVCYINGKRLTVAAVVSRTFTASKDVYDDLLDNGDGTAIHVYTDYTTNAASPALAANSIRCGIIVVGASSIAAATSVNQGQETMVLPIASSIPYAVTDSLGNLICPRDPNRKILGYRQIITNFASGTTVNTAITGLSVPVIVPTGRKIKITTFTLSLSGTTGIGLLYIFDGTTVGGTQLAQSNTVDSSQMMIAQALVTASASKNYIASVQSTVSNPTINAGATSPAYIMVELV